MKRALVVWPRRNGKDIVFLNIAIALAMQRVGLYFYIAPFFTQVRSIIWKGTDDSGKKFLEYIPPELIEKTNESDLRIELINGSSLRFLGSDNVDSIVGNNPVGVFFTEFSLHRPQAWHYLRPVLAANGGVGMFNGTPRGLNHMFQQYQLAVKDPEQWYVQYLTCEDTGVPTQEAIHNDRKSGMPESLIRQEYYCSWTSSAEEILIPLDIIKPRLTTRLPNDYLLALPRPPKLLGVDVAYATLGDKAVISKREGRFLHPLEKYQGKDNMHLATRIVDIIKAWGPDAIFIDSGRGEGVISRLQQLGYSHLVIPIHFSGRPNSDLYLNKRAEIWCRMRDWMANEDTPPLIPNDEDLIGAVSAPTFEINERGLIQIESKKSMRKRNVPSLDEGDAVALTFSEEIEHDPERSKDPYTLEHLNIFKRQRAYDPLTYLEDQYEQRSGSFLQ